MIHTARLNCPSTRFLALFLLLVISLPLQAAAAGAERQLTTRYFTIYYPEGEEKTATWYASFADDVDTEVSDLLGSQPITGLTLHIYATEEEYNRAVPMAELHPGIMAHAIPERKELGVAVERLRNEAPELARESFRHEITHIVAGALSSQKLPVGFQEGLAQYNELSSTRGQEVVQAIQDAQNASVPLLSWRDLNDRQEFSGHLYVAYPESYTVMAFLADRYGMGRFSRFLTELKFEPDLSSTLAYVYGLPIELLEQEWREYLPGFLKDGWKQNLLTAFDMAPGVALYEQGRFAEARDHFAQSEKLYRDMDRITQAEEAARYKDKADLAQQADDLSQQARQSLDKHDYQAAQQQATDAIQRFTGLTLTAQADKASQVARLAGTGLDALTGLESARQHSQLFGLPQAQAEAHKAGEAFALLGDAPRVAEVNRIISDMGAWQRSIGLGALGAAALSVIAGVLATFRSRRKALQKTEMKPLQEENLSWL